MEESSEVRRVAPPLRTLGGCAAISILCSSSVCRPTCEGLVDRERSSAMGNRPGCCSVCVQQSAAFVAALQQSRSTRL